MKHFLLSGVLTTVLVLTLVVMPAPIAKASGLSTSDLDSGLTPEDLVNLLVGGGGSITVTGVTYTGADWAAGTFIGDTDIIGFEEGIILSSGDIANVVGPNNLSNATLNNGLPGDSDLDKLIPGYTTWDATVLEFYFIPKTDQITFEYVFGSEEYNEYVGSPFNDVFGFFLNGVDVLDNVALLPGTTIPVAINNVNCGTNAAYYINNDIHEDDPPSCTINSRETQLDGLTVVLQVIAEVNPGVENHIKLAIADAGDNILDSDVFIKAGSFVPYDPLSLSKTDNIGEGECLEPGDPITYTISYNNTNPEPVDNVVITDILPVWVDDISATLPPTSQVGQTLTWELGTLQPGVPGSIEIMGTVKGDTPRGTVLVNECTINSDVTGLTPYIEETMVCNGPGPGPEPEVGGDVQPVNKVLLLAPWITLGILIAALGTVIMRRRRAQS